MHEFLSYLFIAIYTLYLSFLRFGTSIAMQFYLEYLWNKQEQKMKRVKKEPNIRSIMFAIDVVT